MDDFDADAGSGHATLKAEVQPLFVSLDGIDGSGKSEQVKELIRQIESAGCRAVRWPHASNRPVRSLYRELIGSIGTFPDSRTSLLLALADYSAMLQSPEMLQGDSVLIADRYIYSTFADCLALGIPMSLLAPLGDLFPAPDLSVVVEVPVSIAYARRGSCTLAEAGGPEFVEQYGSLPDAFVAYQTAVSTGYRSLADIGVMRNVHFIDGTGSRAEVSAAISSAFSALKRRPTQAVLPLEVASLCINEMEMKS